jgi:hypothetical protein
MCELGIFKKNKLANWVQSGNFARNEGKDPPAIYSLSPDLDLEI